MTTGGATMDFFVPQTEAAWQRRRSVLERALTDPAARAEVDSGRLAEPFWYVDSPLTTPHPDRVFTGRPPAGHVPPVVPGVLVPDVPVKLGDRPEVTRLREIVRDGLLVLTTGDVALARAAVTAVTTAPVRVQAIGDIDPTGLLAEALEAGPRDAFLVRPDGHVAAVVDNRDGEAFAAAARRALGMADAAVTGGASDR